MDSRKERYEYDQCADGYVIENYTDVRNEKSHGTTSVFLSNDQASATITVKAYGKIYEEAGKAVCVDCPDWVDGYYGRAVRQISLNCRSVDRIKQVGEEEVLMITTRGLCCCPNDYTPRQMDEYVVAFKPIPKELKLSNTSMGNASSACIHSFVKGASDMADAYTVKEGASTIEKSEKEEQPDNNEKSALYAVRKANELSDFIKAETIKSLNDPNVKLKKFIDTPFFERQLELKLRQISKGRALLNKPVVGLIPNTTLPKFKKLFKKDPKDITRRDLFSIRTETLSEKLGMREEDIRRIKLISMGIKFKPEKRNA